jgi:hypothetical protein
MSYFNSLNLNKDNAHIVLIEFNIISAIVLRSEEISQISIYQHQMSSIINIFQ